MIGTCYSALGTCHSALGTCDWGLLFIIGDVRPPIPVFEIVQAMQYVRR